MSTNVSFDDVVTWFKTNQFLCCEDSTFKVVSMTWIIESVRNPHREAFETIQLVSRLLTRMDWNHKESRRRNYEEL